MPRDWCNHLHENFRDACTLAFCTYTPFLSTEEECRTEVSQAIKWTVFPAKNLRQGAGVKPPNICSASMPGSQKKWTEGLVGWRGSRSARISCRPFSHIRCAITGCGRSLRRPQSTGITGAWGAIRQPLTAPANRLEPLCQYFSETNGVHIQNVDQNYNTNSAAIMMLRDLHMTWLL